MKTIIQACVNPRLLTKANRLFTGTVEGRIIEILQNARRAGATQVTIDNRGGLVVVQDNGRGIEDFAKLLDLGSSGWSDELEASEDPAGVGLFCLAPREVIIRSNGRIVTIKDNGWTGAPVDVFEDDDPPQGTMLCFPDSPWEPGTVDLNAVFSSLQVFVDGHECPKLPFVSESAAEYPQLGCKIEVRTFVDLSPWHHTARRARSYCENVVVNFHGQVVAFDYHPLSERSLYLLVDLTGEPTGIRLMLPARTRLVENEALEALKAALEFEAYRYIQRLGEHALPFKEYLRAQELGIQLPEAKPTYRIGLLATADPPDPIEIEAPKDFPLEKCYRFDHNEKRGQETDEANAHLLAALGTFEAPFVPVDISSGYDGYSWVKLAPIGSVKVTLGKELHKDWLWSGMIVCVDSIRIAAQTSDGRTFSSPVCMAVLPADKEHQWAEPTVFVTLQARNCLAASEIWYHLGGWNEDGDTYDTQDQDFTKDLERFWADVLGPDEHLRLEIVASLIDVTPEWRTVTVTSDGKVTIQFADGTEKTIQPPSDASPANS